MDLSALIFVALAVAWAAYLIPKALKHHEEDQRHRTVDRFSSSMRVLATREPVDGRTARLVVPGRPAGAAGSTPAAGSSGTSVTTEAVEVPVEVTVTTPVRRSTARAARRRRRVLGTVVLANLVVATLAAFAVVAWPYLAIPGGLLVAWLVACRLMVKAERSARRPVVRLPGVTPHRSPVEDDGPLTEEIAPSPRASRTPSRCVVGWDPVPVTLPTYVVEGARRPPQRPHHRPRLHRRLDLRRAEIDSAIAREAEQADKADRAAEAEADADRRRATGS